MTRSLRRLCLLLLTFSILFMSSACNKSTEDHKKAREEQKKDSQAPKKKSKTDFNVVTKNISSIPQSAAEYKALHESMATNPEGAAAAYVIALIASATISNKKEAITIFAMTSHSTQLRNKTLGTRDKETLRRLRESPQIAFSYLAETSPKNKYKYKLPGTVEMHSDGAQPTEGKKLYIFSTGADTPRPLVLMKENGLWKVHTSHLITGVARK